MRKTTTPDIRFAPAAARALSSFALVVALCAPAAGMAATVTLGPTTPAGTNVGASADGLFDSVAAQATQVVSGYDGTDSRGADVVHGERDVSGAQHGAGDEAGFVCDPVFAERHDVGEHRRGDDGPGGELDDDDAGGGDDELVGGRDQPAGAGYLDCEWRPRHAQRRMGCCPGGRDVHGGDGAWRARDADVHAGVRDDADGELDGRERCDELQGRAGARRVRSAGDVGGDSRPG